MKFRKKPVVIEAIQWQPGLDVDGVCHERTGHIAGAHLVVPHVHTLEGPLKVAPGDWIITGVNGERYPIKDEIFRKTYDQAD